MPKASIRLKERRHAREDVLTHLARWLGLGVVALVLTGFTPLANDITQLMRPASDLRPADAIVVLGSDANPDGTLDGSSLVRFVRGTVLYRESFAPIIVYSGTPLEVETRVHLAQVLGVPASAILSESRVRTTAQEALRISEQLKARSARRILLVTSSQHLPRASRLFETAGLAVSPVPADDVSDAVTKPGRRLVLLRVVLQELAARVYNRAAGHP